MVLCTIWSVCIGMTCLCWWYVLCVCWFLINRFALVYLASVQWYIGMFVELSTTMELTVDHNRWYTHTIEPEANTLVVLALSDRREAGSGSCPISILSKVVGLDICVSVLQGPMGGVLVGGLTGWSILCWLSMVDRWWVVSCPLALRPQLASPCGSRPSVTVLCACCCLYLWCVLDIGVHVTGLDQPGNMNCWRWASFSCLLGYRIWRNFSVLAWFGWSYSEEVEA
jgi:hypothetical protein